MAKKGTAATGQYSDDREHDFGTAERIESARQARLDELRDSVKAHDHNVDDMSDDEVVVTAIDEGILAKDALVESYHEAHPEVDPANDHPPKGLDTLTASEVSPTELFLDKEIRDEAENLGLDRNGDVHAQIEHFIASRYHEVREVAETVADVGDDPAIGDDELRDAVHDETVRQLTGNPDSPLDAETIVAHIGGSERAQANEIRQRLIDEHGYSEDQLAGRSLQELTNIEEWHDRNDVDAGADTGEGVAAAAGGTVDSLTEDNGFEREGIGTAAGTTAETEAEATLGTSVQLGPTDPIDPVESGSVDEDAYTTVVSGSRSDTTTLGDGSGDENDGYWENEGSSGSSDSSGDDTGTGTDADGSDEEESGDDDDSDDGDPEDPEDTDAADAADDGESDESADTSSDEGTPQPDGDVAEDPADRTRFEDSRFGEQQRQNQVDAIDDRGGRFGGPDVDPADADAEAFASSRAGAEAAETLADGVEMRRDGGDRDPTDLDAQESNGPVIELEINGGGVSDPVDVPSPADDFGGGVPMIDIPVIAGGPRAESSFDEPDTPTESDSSFGADAGFDPVGDVMLDVPPVDVHTTDVQVDLDDDVAEDFDLDLDVG